MAEKSGSVESFGWVEYALIIILVLAVVAAAFTLFYPLVRNSVFNIPSIVSVKNAVESKGFVEVVVTGPDTAKGVLCPEDKPFYFDVKAKTKQGEDVDMFVCAGIGDRYQYNVR